MLFEIQKRQCLRCGHKFIHPLGGFVLIDNPPCPVCRSTTTIVIDSTRASGLLKKSLRNLNRRPDK